MPTVSPGNLTLLRTTKHATKLGLTVYSPPAIWTTQVSGGQTTGARAITVDAPTVTRAPARNYQVFFGSAAGLSDLGEARFESYSAPTLNVSAHNAPLADDTFITVREFVAPTAIHVAVSGTDVVSEDGNIAYGAAPFGANPNIQYLPVSRCGTHAVAYLDRITGLATVNFYGRGTAVATGAVLAGHAWVWRGGTVIAGATNQQGTSGVPNTVTWDTEGDYWCSYTVTDSNGKTAVRYFVVFIRAYNSANVYTALQVSQLGGDVSTGTWQAALDVMTTAGPTKFPDGALCVLFAEDYFGDTKQSIGNELYRENIVMAAYVRTGTTKADAVKSSVSFEIESASGVMGNLWDLAGTLTNTGSTPADWHTLQSMTYNLAAYHILTQHSTITQITDCYFNLPNYAVASGVFTLQDTTLKSQLDSLCQAVRSRFGCNAQGALYLEINPQLQSLAARSTAYVLTTTNADIKNIDLGEEEIERATSMVEVAGVQTDGNPLWSRAPVATWEDGTSSTESGIVVSDQTECNEFSGLFEGYKNNPHANMIIEWRGDYRFDCFPAEPLRFNITAAQNVRGIVMANQRCWTSRVSMDYSPGILNVTTTIEKDAYGVPGMTWTYPPTPPVIPTPYPPTPVPNPIPTPIPIPPPPAPPGLGDLLYVTALPHDASSGGVAKCVSAYTDPTTCTWTAINTGLTTEDDKYIYAFSLDPWSASGGEFTAAYLMSKTGFWRCDGLPSAGVWTQKLSPAAAAALIGAAGSVTLQKSFATSVLQSGLVGALCRDNVTACTYFIWSLNRGDTWHVDKTYYLGGCGTSEIYPSYTSDNLFLISTDMYSLGSYPNYNPPPFGGLSCQLFKITSLATPEILPWIATYGSQSARYVTLPYCNPSGYVYGTANPIYQWQGQGYGSPHIWRIDTSVVYPINCVRVELADPAMQTGPYPAGHWTIYIHMMNENYCYSHGINNTSLANHVFTSIDRAASWVHTAVPDQLCISNLYPVPANRKIIYIIGDNGNGAGNRVRCQVSKDFGITWTRFDVGTNNLETVLNLGDGATHDNIDAGSFIVIDHLKV